jgi:hypothetical protein
VGLGRKARQASTAFLKKSSKKLLILVGSGSGFAKAHGEQKFFGSFFQKRTAYFLSNTTTLSTFSEYGN